MKRIKIFHLFFILLISNVTLFGQIPSKGLVLYLPLNGNVKDSSSYKNNGTAYNLTYVADRFDRQNKAMYFNGNGRIQIPFSQNLNLSANKTVSCWIYLPGSMSVNNYSTIIFKEEPIQNCTYSLVQTEEGGYFSDRYKFDFFYSLGNVNYQTHTKQLYPDYKNQWINITATYDTISGYSKIYMNGVISDSTYFGKKISNTANTDLTIGCGKNNSYYPQTFFKGYLDDIRLYNRAVDKNEIYQLFMEGKCNKSVRNDTTTYYVSTETFKSLSPRYQFIKTDTLYTKMGGCDSIINRYAKFEFSSKDCTITNSISVTDTLIINLKISELPTNNLNSLKIYPNPTKNYLNINFGDYSKMTGYLLTIKNELGVVVYTTTVVTGLSSVEIKTWSAGVYIIQIFDSQSKIAETRKLIVTR